MADDLRGLRCLTMRKDEGKEEDGESEESKEDEESEEGKLDEAEDRNDEDDKDDESDEDEYSGMCNNDGCDCYPFCSNYEACFMPVSYTHLTLPTIYSV